MKKQLTFALLCIGFLYGNTLFAVTPLQRPIDGLVGYWSFDNHLMDGSGNGNTATITGAAVYTSESEGKLNRALVFTAGEDVNDRVSVKLSNMNGPPKNFGIEESNAFTVMLWVNPGPTLPTTDYTNIIGSGPYVCPFAIDLYNHRRRDDPSRLRTRIRTVSDVRRHTEISNIELVDGNWYHVALTYENGIRTVYLNGTEDSSAELEKQTLDFRRNPSQVVRLGGLFNGMLDEVRIFNRALSPIEIAAEVEYGGGAENLSIPEQPTGLSVSTITDSSITLQWARNREPDIVSYHIYRDSSETPIGIVSHPNTSYTDSSLIPENTYTYQITAVDSDGDESAKTTPLLEAVTLKQLLRGDVNDDDTVNMIDAEDITNYVAGGNVPNFNPIVADVNCDNAIDSKDAQLIAGYSNREIEELPACQVAPPPHRPDKDLAVMFKMGPYVFGWDFATPVESGVFIDGQPWVVAPPEGIRLIEAFPARKNNQVVSTAARGGRERKILIADIDMTVINPPVGTYINENARQTGTAHFGWDSRGCVRYGNVGAGYDRSLPWDGTTPVTLYPGDSVVTAKSFRIIPYQSSNRNSSTKETALEAAAILTVLDKAPPSDAFRPGMLRSEGKRKKPDIYRLSDVIDTSNYLISLPNGDIFGKPFEGTGVFNADNLSSLFPGPSILNKGVLGSRCTNADYNNSGQTYGANVARAMGDLTLCALADWIEPDVRKTCLIRTIQRGIDTYDAVQAGISLTHGGGFLPGYGALITITGLLLNNEDMLSINRSVHGKPPHFYFSDFSQFYQIVEPEDEDLSERKVSFQNPEFGLNVEELTVQSATANSALLDSTSENRFEWQVYRAGMQVPNSKLRIDAGAGAGATIYTIIDLKDYTYFDAPRNNDDNLVLDENGNLIRSNRNPKRVLKRSKGSRHTPWVFGGTLVVSPAWQHGLPDETSRITISPFTSRDVGKWEFIAGAVDYSGRLKLPGMCRSPLHQYASIVPGAYLTYLVTLEALDTNKRYQSHVVDWLVDILSTPGYGEHTINGRHSRYITRPHPRYPTRALIGGLWREMILTPRSKTFVFTDGTRNNLPYYQNPESVRLWND